MTTTATERPRETKATHFQPHIQGLRAIAVILVVLYHFWPGRLSGGYIGVDIFFVISGFLITGQLARELERTGRIALPSFWAKRARRLLPASFTVLFFSLLATLFILPLSSLVDSLREILASTFYVENWSLAASSVDYLASHDATLAQHYWSLGVEEQFYIVWPLLLLGATWLGAKFFSRRRWLPMIAVVVLVTAISIVISLVYTHTDPAQAFFVTQTRVWEFGAGAILALLPRLRPTRRWLSNLLGYAGLLIILVCAYRYNQDTQFPGTAALLPVIGAGLVIVSARAERWYDAGGLLGIRPARFIGDISYSVYLWHWPLIIIAPYIPGWGLDGWNRVVLFIGSFVLGWLSKKFIEDPARTWKWLVNKRPRVTYAFVVAGMAVLALTAGIVFAVQNPSYQAAAAELKTISANPPACFGALAGPDCTNPALANKVIPDAGFGNADKPGHDNCFVQLNESAVTACHFGSKDADAPRIALIGDSHAYQYIETMIRLADDNGWSLTTYLKGACPWNTTPIGGPSVAFTDSCHAWLGNLSSTLAKAPKYDAIVVGALHDTPYPGATDATIADGFENAWTQAKGAPIVAMVDNPDFLTDPNKCLRTSSPADCTEARSDVLAKVDPLAVAAAKVGATPVDLTDKYCDATKCFSVIGGANVYRDQDHLTVTWTLTMQKAIGDAVQQTLAKYAKAPLE
ncbi:MAG: acyltransferase [Microbacteriaceae bacterium]|nr:acyltransferase [Microbacteriaceae bacterium]